jgi:hypothetical protein
MFCEALAKGESSLSILALLNHFSKNAKYPMSKSHFIFGTVVVLLLAFFDGPLAKQMVDQYLSTKYPSTAGQVTQSGIGNYETHGSKFIHIHYFPDVGYSYEINGQKYEGRRFCYARYYSEEFSQKVAELHPVGSQIQVFYNPKNPQDTVLSAGFGQVDSRAIIQIFVQANFFVAVVVVLWLVKARRQTKVQISQN